METFTTANLKITTARITSANRICYVLYPLDCLGQWVDEAARRFGVSIAVITGMDWDNDLTPWKAKGEPRGSADFEGNARKFLLTLTSEVVPAVERRLNISSTAERTLTGVSLSGLFALWQWMVCDTFRNVISLSGSFWYDGFVEWLKSQPAPSKTGKIYFLLGNLEAKTKVKVFQSVQTDTIEIYEYLKANGINDCFELVTGNHYQYGIERLNRAFAWMFVEAPD